MKMKVSIMFVHNVTRVSGYGPVLDAYHHFCTHESLLWMQF